MLRAGAILCGNFSLGTREDGPLGARKRILGVCGGDVRRTSRQKASRPLTLLHATVHRRGRQGRLSVRVVGVAEVAEHRHARLVAPGKQLDCCRMSAARMTPLR